MADEQRCEELREALKTARAQLELPMRDQAVPGVQQVAFTAPDTTPDATPELQAEIRRLEQALRDAGCEE